MMLKYLLNSEHDVGNVRVPQHDVTDSCSARGGHVHVTYTLVKIALLLLGANK